MGWIRLELDTETHRQLKADAALAGLTLAAYLEKLLTDASTKTKGQQP